MITPRQRLAGLAVTVVLTVGALAPIADRFSTLRAQSTERQMYVSVLDEDGAPIADLTADEFVVREDDVRREVLRVSRATAPMHVALLVDNSQAATVFIRDLRDGLERFVSAMAGGNELAVLTFGDRPTIVLDYRRSQTELLQAVRRVLPRPNSGAYLLDAIYDAARGLGRREAPRPVMVVVTTEGIDYSNRSYQSVLDSLEESGAILHAIVLTSAGATMRTDAWYRDLVLDQGTRRSGGWRHDLLIGQRIPQTLDALAEELLNQYLLTYSRPETLVPPRRIDLDVTRESATVRGTPVKTD